MGMDPVTGAIVGNVAGSLVGGMFGNKAAKYGANANAYAINQQMRPYNLKEPYYEKLFKGAQDALDQSLKTGAYQGDTYAGLTDAQKQGIAGLTGFGNKAMGMGNTFMDIGGAYGQNMQDLYNRASGNSLDAAVNYAANSPQAQSMIDAAMRDSTRQLQERTLPGIGMSASATNNTNSSRAGVAEAIAQRSYDDRRADVASDVGRDLTNQYLRSNQNDFNMAMRANQGLSDVFGMGQNLAVGGAEALGKAGGMLQMDNQGQLDADREAFERYRDFAMGQYGQMNNILGGVPNVGQVTPNTSNPYTAMLSGAMMGAGFGGNIADYFSQRRQQPMFQQYGYMTGNQRPYTPPGL